MLNDAQGNTFNPNIQYRGFESSPVGGFAQGIAVYQNGVRINEVFGDIVNFDALPSNAIAGATIMSGNPVFGLNAIGGALNLTMKDGFSYQGGEIDTRFGSFSRRQVGAQAGMRSGPFAVYAASEWIHDGGFRDHSSSNVRRLYADLGAKGDGNELHLSFTGAHNSFGVAAATPVPLLDISRKLTFTTPQTTENEIKMLQLNGSTQVTPTLQLAGVVYGRFFKQYHVDGNIAEIRNCRQPQDEPVGPRHLCASEGDAPRDHIEDINGDDILAINNPGSNNGFGYGTIDRTQQDAKSFGGSVQATEKSQLLGMPNQLIVGASIDHGTVKYGANSELGLSDSSLVVSGTGIMLGDERAPRSISAKNDYIGVFFSNTLDLTSQLALTVGGRYNFARIELEDNTGNFPDITSQHSFQRFNPMAGASYKLFPGLTVYGGYSEANRAPTPAELACADPVNPCLIESFLTDDPPLKQVVSHTYETGLKGELSGPYSGRVNWSLGFFRTLNSDDIISVAAAEAGRGYFINAGETLRQGIEASLEYRTERFFGYVGYSYVDATFRNTLEIASANNNFAGPCSADPTNDEVFCSHVTPGNRLPGISPHKFKMGAE
jgi:outer membrane receptor protein involved in Fe transport